MIYSLAMTFEQMSDGTWIVRAPWLRGGVEADTYALAYHEAVRRYHTRG